MMFDDFFFATDSYWFNRPLKDMNPWHYSFVNGDGQLVLNTLGVSPDDLAVEVHPHNADQMIVVTGKTKKFEKEYSVNMKFYIKEKIDTIDRESEDGVTVLHIKFETPAKPEVKISRK